jgi:hypothetical protein
VYQLRDRNGKLVESGKFQVSKWYLFFNGPAAL